MREKHPFLPAIARAAACGAVLLAAVLLSGAGQQAPARKITFTAEQQSALDKVSAYLNSIHSLKSNFIQLGPEGQLDQGEFLLEKPGKMRFAFYPPNPILIVASGGHVYVKNARLNTVESYSASDIPLGLILDEKVNLKLSSAITGIDVTPDSLVVHARTTTNRQQGNIALVFSYPQIELRQWTVKDNQGATTMVALHGALTGETIDPAAFAVPVKNPPKVQAKK